MEENQLRFQITQIFQTVFGDPDMVITDTLTAGDVEQWDSLAQMNLIVGMERQFGIKFTTSEVMKLGNVGDLTSLVRSKVASLASVATQVRNDG